MIVLRDDFFDIAKVGELADEGAHFGAFFTSKMLWQGERHCYANRYPLYSFNQNMYFIGNHLFVMKLNEREQLQWII